MISVSYIIEITRRDFAERFAGSILGSLWAIIRPMVNLFVYIVIFGKLMGARLPGASQMNAYGIYLAAGLIPWVAFSATIQRCAPIFVNKKHIIKKVNTSLFSLLLHVVLSETITYVISMAIFLILLVGMTYEFHAALLFFPVLYYLQQVLALAIGLLSAVLNVFIRDVREIIGVIVQLWFWFTPIVYVFDILPDLARKIIAYNPAYIFIQSYHNIFVFDQYPVWGHVLVLAVFAHVFLFFSYGVFRFLERDIRDFL